MPVCKMRCRHLESLFENLIFECSCCQIITLAVKGLDTCTMCQLLHFGPLYLLLKVNVAKLAEVFKNRPLFRKVHGGDEISARSANFVT
jgi:hypothetical protein